MQSCKLTQTLSFGLNINTGSNNDLQQGCLEDLKYMRDGINYGTWINRRLHSLPFAALRDMVSYNAVWDEILSDKVDPECMSQPMSKNGVPAH